MTSSMDVIYLGYQQHLIMIEGGIDSDCQSVPDLNHLIQPGWVDHGGTNTESI